MELKSSAIFRQLGNFIHSLQPVYSLYNQSIENSELSCRDVALNWIQVYREVKSLALQISTTLLSHLLIMHSAQPFVDHEKQMNLYQKAAKEFHFQSNPKNMEPMIDQMAKLISMTDISQLSQLTDTIDIDEWNVVLNEWINMKKVAEVTEATDMTEVAKVTNEVDKEVFVVEELENLEKRKEDIQVLFKSSHTKRVKTGKEKKRLYGE